VLYVDPQSIYTRFVINNNNGAVSSSRRQVHVEGGLSTLTTPEMKSLAHASHVDNCMLVVRDKIVVKVVKPPQEIVHQYTKPTVMIKRLISKWSMNLQTMLLTIALGGLFRTIRMCPRPRQARLPSITPDVTSQQPTRLFPQMKT
jgi:hypothetical protein